MTCLKAWRKVGLVDVSALVIGFLADEGGAWVARVESS